MSAQTIPFSIVVGEDCHLGLSNKAGKEILPTQYATIDVVSIGNTYLISTRVKQTAAFFLYQQEKMIELPYPSVERFNDRLLKVGEEHNWGLINTEGKGIAVMNYQAIEPIGSEMAMTKSQNGYGVLDIDGKVVLANRYDAIHFWEGNGFLVEKDGAYTFHDVRGKFKQKTNYDAVNIPEGIWSLCAVAQKEKWGLMNKAGNLVVGMDYQAVQFFESGIIAMQEKSGHWKLWTSEGEPASEQAFDQVQNGGSISCLVQVGAKYGLLASSGRFVLPLEDRNLVYINGDCLLQQKGKEWSVINLATLEELDVTFDAYQYQEGWAGFLVQINQQWGWMNLAGQLILPPNYTSVSAIDDNTILVTGDNKKLGAISTTGQQLVPMEYIAIVPKGKVYKVKQTDTDWFYIDQTGTRKACQVY